METDLISVALEAKHQELGAKMVSFAGYLMPLQYTSVVKEHKAVRDAVGIFDVSHMGEFILRGPKALDLIQKISSNDASKLTIGKAQYSCMPNDKGGVVDDLIIYQLGEEEYLLVVNASNIEKDWNWIKSHNTENVEMIDHSNEISLFAVQGPLASKVLQKLTKVTLDDIPYYTFEIGEIGGIQDVIISATGYTGAGGFELYVPNTGAEKLWDAIIEAGQEENIQPIGLGARDTLRLEMGFCLYGNDIDDTTSPLEAGLGWITKFSKPFINSKALQQQKVEGITRKLIGFEMLERGIPRAGYTIYNKSNEAIGKVTSGSQSPILEKGIGLGYVTIPHAKVDSSIFIEIRNKKIKAIVKKTPFIKK
ncbi:glycine cleavage system aminomethyltransferase GcvT [Aquimarina sediminis]|uniref:glycine cleavage system aminomethyltransferase GcvT n=1 Tax=Aquimarina sediminis TaxID=2070536 RepID=UPI000CA02D65|nr:glycine cleavage system aminomethyltransferase GcvT [Aquimarina sediminis]